MITTRWRCASYLGYCCILRFVNHWPNETSMYGSCEILCGCKGISLTCNLRKDARLANDTCVLQTIRERYSERAEECQSRCPTRSCGEKSAKGVYSMFTFSRIETGLSVRSI